MDQTGKARKGRKSYGKKNTGRNQKFDGGKPRTDNRKKMAWMQTTKQGKTWPDTDPHLNYLDLVEQKFLSFSAQLKLVPVATGVGFFQLEFEHIWPGTEPAFGKPVATTAYKMFHDISSIVRGVGPFWTGFGSDLLR